MLCSVLTRTPSSQELEQLAKREPYCSPSRPRCPATQQCIDYGCRSSPTSKGCADGAIGTAVFSKDDTDFVGVYCLPPRFMCCGKTTDYFHMRKSNTAACEKYRHDYGC